MFKINAKNKRFTRIEINLSNLADNIRLLKSYCSQPKVKIMAVVKSNAYGHGLVDISKHAVKSGANALGVALAEDALKLRKAGIKVPIFILGEPPIEIVKDAIKYGFILCLNSCQKAKLISDICSKYGKKLDVHLKVDTGMNRVGINYKDAVEEILAINNLKGLKVKGIFTHFSCASDPDPSYTLMQWKRFQAVLEELQNSKINSNNNFNLNDKIVHCANSAAFLRFKNFHCNMVRLGISIYGLSPFSAGADSWLSEEVKEIVMNLKPILCLKSKVAFVKKVSSGQSISYGATFTTKRESIIATIPIGYADGYSRLLSNKAYVLINGGYAPVVGNVTMDQIMVDVTDIKNNETIKEGTDVILIGNSRELSNSLRNGGKNGAIINTFYSSKLNEQNNKISADYLASLMGTINYEVLCMLKDRIPRIYIY